MVEIPKRQKQKIETFNELKAGRVNREAKWREVMDYCDVNDDGFDQSGLIAAEYGSVEARPVYTAVGILNAKRCAAFITSYMVNPSRPFLTANVELQADMSDGFVTQNALAGAEKDYLSGLSWAMHGDLMRGKSGFLSSTSLSLLDFVNYGPGITFSELNFQGQSRFTHCSIKNCWIRVNENGEVDTLYRRRYFRLARLVEVYPAALGHERLSKLHEKKNAGNTFVCVVHAVEPRAGGVKGDVATNKPFESVMFLPDYDGHIVKDEGFDTFPYSLAINGATESNPYGVGISETALPELKALNHYQAGLENNIDLINEPPMMYMAGLFDKFSYDAGALTPVDGTGQLYGNLKDAIVQLPVAGQVQPVMAYMDRLEARVGELYFTDWMRLRENKVMTATEVNDIRDLRIRGISSLVPGINPMLSNTADRILELKVRRRMIPPPPVSLSRRSVDWDYSGPLADALKAIQSDVGQKLMGVWQGLIKEAPEVADIIDIESVIRNWADYQGAEPGNLRSEAAVAERRKARADEAAEARERDNMTAAAAATRDAAQGLASMANAGDGRALELMQQQVAA